MKSCNTSHERLVVRVLQHLLGVRQVRLTPVRTYPDSIVYEAATEQATVVFKACDPSGRDPDGIGVEAWACEDACSRGVPAPRVVHADTSGLEFPGSFLVMAKALGEPWDPASLDPEQRRVVARQVGELLALLHQRQVPGFGWLDEGHHRRTGEVVGSHPTWRSALLHELDSAAEYLTGSVLDPATAKRLATAVEAMNEAAFDLDEGVLLHGDLGGVHVRIDPATLQVTGIIDFGERGSGDWRWDLLEIEPRDLPPVLEGYGTTLDDELTATYWNYALLKAVPWAAKWHNRGEPAVIDWLTTVLSQSTIHAT